MRVKFIKDEDFVQYKKACMFIGTPSCTFKCLREKSLPLSICQNYPWYKEPIIEISNEELMNRYCENNLISSICFGGLEPIDNWQEIKDFLLYFIQNSSDDIIIYTGYTEEECSLEIDWIKNNIINNNVIFKFGRFIGHEKPHYDEVLGVKLASNNQYGKFITTRGNNNE